MATTRLMPLHIGEGRSFSTAIEDIIDYVENDCRLDPVFDERGNQFYRWFDADNCKRVYEEIRGLDG